MFLPQLVYRWREWERGTMGRRRGASVLYVQREFEHVFHLNICTWNSNVANLHKMFSTTITVKNFISFSCYVHRKWDFSFLKILFFSNFQIWFVHFLSFFFIVLNDVVIDIYRLKQFSSHLWTIFSETRANGKFVYSTQYSSFNVVVHP